MAQLSDETLEYLRDWLAWVERGAPQNVPYDRCQGLCANVCLYTAEPYVQPVMKLNAREKKPWVRHDWTPGLLGKVQRWVNRRLWKSVPFAEYDVNARSRRQVAVPLLDGEAT